MTSNQINYWNLQESKRHNVTTENETNRHNLVTEVETNRHNVATENIDLSKLGETKRHNLVTEGQTDKSLGMQQQNINLGYANLAEQSRHNQATENLTNRDLSIKADTLYETGRHNLTTEGIQQQHEDAYTMQSKSQALLNDIQRTWSGLLSSTNVSINEAQKDKINAEIEKINSEVHYMPDKNIQGYWNSVNGSLQALAKMVDGLIPG